MSSKKNILVCPLNWGLGHATRIVPVIDMLLSKEANVIIAADHGPYDFLTAHYPQLKVVRLSGFVPVYHSERSMAKTMLLAFPEMISSAKKARNELDLIVTKHRIDAIISDNRYEIFSKKIPSIFVTHQLNINTVGFQSLAKPIIDVLINHYVSKFDEMWIPDHTEINLSGKLSNSKKCSIKTHCIGLLSRFNSITQEVKPIDSDIVIISSGPEPQKSILQKSLLDQFIDSNYRVIVLEGKPGKKETKTVNNIEFYSHVDDEMFVRILLGAGVVISRPGYSTLMDLITLGKTGIFIPTPGQTEQIYLANRLSEEGRAIVVEQNQINKISDAIDGFDNNNMILPSLKSTILEERIDHLLKIC